MTKTYAKKREVIRAAQWTGEMTPEFTDLVAAHVAHVDGDQQLVFSNPKGPGRFARKGDWVVSSSGEDLFVIGDEQFRKIYEEVDDTGRALPPSAEAHESAARDFVRELDGVLIDGLKLSREEHPDIFRDRERLMRTLRHLFEDQAYTARRDERHRIRNKIAEDLTP